MYIIKRDGRKQEIFFDKVSNRIKALALKNPMLKNVDPILISKQVIQGLYTGVTTVELDNLAAETAASMSTVHPEYEMLASRLTISNMHKMTEDDYGKTCDTLYHYINPKINQHSPLITKEIYDIIKVNIDKIQAALNYEQDYTYDYAGIKTLKNSYLIKINGENVERIQHMLMRVAIGIYKNDIEGALTTYKLLSQKYYTLATPTLFNAGTVNGQLSSCFLIAMKKDSIKGIYDTLKQTASISKGAGGVGLAVHNVRAKNSYIKGTNGTAEGLVPMLKIFNDTARFVSQGGNKRKGSFSVYLEAHHADIEDFLELKKNGGKEELRCRDLFYAIWMNDLFMERVEKDLHWSLFCPNEAPGLHLVYGNEYKALYERYEKEGRARKTVKAQLLWEQMVKSQIETGVPYLMYKDKVNEHNNQANLGTIQCSNLCTEIVEYTDKDTVSSCNLGSVSLPSFIINGEFNHQLLYDIVYHLVKDLNQVIDQNNYPIIETKTTNLKHRPIGIGIQGLADLFILLRLPFDSLEAKKLNQEILETMYYAATRSSCDLAKIHGCYESFQGSPASKGILTPDMWHHQPTSRWPFNTLRTDIVTYGLRNSLLIALMPTVSTAVILGNNESFEPYNTNIYVKRTLSGDNVVINKHLIKDLLSLGIWNEHLKNQIIANNGSVQGIKEIPSDLQLLYRTVWEVPLKEQINMHSDRGVFVDQAQSFNVHMAVPTVSKLSSMHFYAWKLKGIKTSSYYVRSKPAADAIKFTLNKELTTKVIMYTKPLCKYCISAKELLNAKNIKYEEYNIEDSHYKQEMNVKTNGAKTVPQIFINNQLIGGFTELESMLETDEGCVYCSS